MSKIKAVIDRHTCDYCLLLDGAHVVEHIPVPPFHECTNENGCRCKVVLDEYEEATQAVRGFGAALQTMPILTRFRLFVDSFLE